MKTTFLLIASLALAALGISGTSTVRAADADKAVEVMFLGDRAGHRPAERYAILAPVLTNRSIRMTYTESVEDLNPARLATVDCLVIYANITHLPSEQDKALMDFVAEGGGLVALHCASFCFQNSSNYVALVGAQFARHGTGVFKETILLPEHPVMQGLTAIESWDETYVHRRHNTNRVVLAERRDDRGAEPWTWVREHGKGRVFYTAWGHDQRTWSNAGFQDLVEHGIRWAAANSTNLVGRTN